MPGLSYRNDFLPQRRYPRNKRLSKHFTAWKNVCLKAWVKCKRKHKDLGETEMVNTQILGDMPCVSSQQATSYTYVTANRQRYNSIFVWVYLNFLQIKLVLKQVWWQTCLMICFYNLFFFTCPNYIKLVRNKWLIKKMLFR